MTKLAVTLLALILPEQLESVPLLPPTRIAGLETTSYLVRAEPEQVTRFLASDALQERTGGCQVLQAGPEQDWLCLNDSYLFSYQYLPQAGIWTQTRRVGGPVKPEDFHRVSWSGGQVKMTEVDTPMFALYQRLLREQEHRGAQLQELERQRDNFVQRWRLPDQSLVFVAWQVAPGRVVLTTVRSDA